MRRAINFAKRNFIEMIRDPLIYVFCLGFPVVMIAIFTLINSFTNGSTPMFEPKALIPGIIMFSFTFVMLLESILVSKDRTSAFLTRLFTSPMRTFDFVMGYSVPCIIIGILQSIICIFTGFIFALCTGKEYFQFLNALLLILQMLPILIIFVFLGIFFGTVLNDKSSPGICSIIISASGLLGGAWMPLETMGKFEAFCRYLPFYPSVYIGRIITGAEYSFLNGENIEMVKYTFDTTAKLGLVTIFIYFAISIAISLIFFKKNMKFGK